MLSSNKEVLRTHFPFSNIVDGGHWMIHLEFSSLYPVLHTRQTPNFSHVKQFSGHTTKKINFRLNSQILRGVNNK